MRDFLFASDLHGKPERLQALESAIAQTRPAAVLLGGDLLPHFASADAVGYVQDALVPAFERLAGVLGADYPDVALILGNDDAALAEEALRAAEGLWQYAHKRRVVVAGWPVFGYNCVPPTPFRLKDFERYDVSRYVDPGCVPPEEGLLTREVPLQELRFGTIQADLEELVGEERLENAILLTHVPPYRTSLDRAALDGQRVEHVPLDLHIGSIAVRRLVEARCPRVGLHGHVHEAARLTGTWRERLHETWLFTGAHDGPELALVRFDPEDPAGAERFLIGGGVWRVDAAVPAG